MPFAGFLGVAVTFIAPVDTCTLATASSATARHDVVPGQAMAFIASAGKSPDQTLTALVAALMTALLPLRSSSKPTETHVLAVGQVTPSRESTPVTEAARSAGAAAALAAAGTTRIPMATMAAATCSRALPIVKLPPQEFPEYHVQRSPSNGARG